MSLPIAQRWGGDHSPQREWWRVLAPSHYPSTMLRMVPLPTGYAGREEL